ncbi:MAG: aminoglycoside phosphotransferase family protein [Bacteroidota bacterium]
MPEAEIEININLIRTLIKTQFPDFLKYKLEFLDEGWDNAMYRLGRKYMVRVPRRKVADQLMKNEQKWLPFFSEKLPVPIPAPVCIGLPGNSYPWHWSIIPWFDGRSSDLAKPNDFQAETLVGFLKKLHVPAPPDVPLNEVRDVPLKIKSPDVLNRFRRLKKRTNLVTEKIENIWQAGISADLNKNKTWIHGDLHPRNIIVKNGEIKAVIDWGDMTAGDPATDLSSLWMLFEKEIAFNAMKKYGASEDLIKRAKGWAVFFGAILLDTGLVNSPQHATIGTSVLEKLNK